MLRALQSKSVDQVLRILREDPESANEPFWEHELETPLCAASRLHCGAEIMDALLEHGASPEQCDVGGRTAAHRSQHVSTPRLANSELATLGLDAVMNLMTYPLFNLQADVFALPPPAVFHPPLSSFEQA